jgi:hypothetical protein
MFCGRMLRHRNPCSEFLDDFVRKISAEPDYFRTPKQIAPSRPGIDPGLFARIFPITEDRHHHSSSQDVFPVRNERLTPRGGARCSGKNHPAGGNNTPQQPFSKGLLSLKQGRPARISISIHGRFTNANQSTSTLSHYSTHRLRGGDGSGSEGLHYWDRGRSE